jgi:hypothetical protein
MKRSGRPTVHTKAVQMSVVAVLETGSEVTARNVSQTGTDTRFAQAAADVGPTNAAAEVRTPDASSKVASSKVTSPTVTASATACKGVGCQCGASQRHGQDGNRDPLHNRALHDCHLICLF